MRAATTTILTSGFRWYEWYPTAPISQHPSMWRFLAYGYFRGSANLGLPGTTSWTSGFGVFDWNYAEGRYELTRFSQLPSGYGITSNSTYAWVNNTDVRIVGSLSDSSTTTTRYAGKLSVSTTGTFTYIQPTTTVCGNDTISFAVFYGGWGVGYNGGIAYPYSNGTFTPSLPTSNCYIGKITDTNSATNLGPLRTSLTQAAQHAPLCSLGGGSGNGYAVGVQNTGQDSTSGTVYAGLYNIANSTTTLLATNSFSGRPNTWSPLHLGVRKVVVPDYNDTDYNGKVTLLYTNSDTSPTSLTKGSSVFAPTLPFRATDVDRAAPVAGGFSCQNFWAGEGRGAGVTVYSLDTNLEVGETTRTYYLPCKYISTSTSDLSISTLSADYLGNPVPADTWWSSELQDIGNYAFQFVGAPGEKAALFWKLGSTESNTNQTVFQL